MSVSRAERASEARTRARDLALRLHGLEQAGEERHDEAFCRALVRELAAEGLLRHIVPAPFGGAAPAVEVEAVAAIREELAYGSGLLDLMFVMQGLGAFPIALAGSEALKARLLPPVAEGRSIAAFAVTEPGAGSDVSAIQTSARREGESYVIDGTKTFISNGLFADIVTVIVQADPGKGRKGLTAFAVERGAAAGLEAESIDTIAPHPLATLVFTGCRVPTSSRLGEEGDGFRIVMATLGRYRTTVGAAAIGFARRALDEAVRHAKDRVQFGQPIAEFEGIQFKLAEMATKTEAARLLVERAAGAVDRAEDLRLGGSPHAPDRSAASFPLSPLGEDASREASMAKLFATEAAQEVVDEAVQIHGARGLVRGSVVENLYREVRALRIYEGTSEIQRTIIGRSLVGR